MGGDFNMGIYMEKKETTKNIKITIEQNFRATVFRGTNKTNLNKGRSTKIFTSQQGPEFALDDIAYNENFGEGYWNFEVRKDLNLEEKTCISDHFPICATYSMKIKYLTSDNESDTQSE